MSRYVITDGNQYYKRDFKGKPSFVNGLSLADEMDMRTAKNVLNNTINKRDRKRFHIEAINPDGKVSHIIKSNDDIRAEIKKTEIDLSILNLLDNVYSKVTDVSLPEIEELHRMRTDLSDALSYYDMAKSDIYHLIKDKNPPAHIRTKIYGIAQEKEQMRANIKEKIRYVDLLIEAYNQDWTLSKIRTGLLKAKEVAYKGRTPVYDQILELING